MAASALATRAIRGLAKMRMSTSSAAARGKATKAAGGCVAVVYISEGKDAVVMDELESTAERACAKHGARVVNVFRDVEYNRTGFTLGVRLDVGVDGSRVFHVGLGGRCQDCLWQLLEIGIEAKIVFLFM